MSESKDKFYINPYNHTNKTIAITEEGGDGYTNLNIDIMFDDVDHDIIEEKVKKLVKILNEHW